MIHPNFAEDEQFVQMLIDEAKISVQLTHVNIAHTFDLGRVGDTYYITMEFVDGADLYHLLRKSSELDVEMPLDVCAFIAKEMTTGLDYAHRKKDMGGTPLGIVHRDVSPQNVLVSYAGEIKLVDFGIAKATMKAKQTAVGVIKGKYYYMSPEQAWGDVVDHRSDIFSAGIVLYEMMTGQMLYLEEDLHRLLELVRNANIAPPSKLRKNIPPQLERIVMHALAKAPADRYQNAADFAADLERFLHGYSPVFAASKIANHLRSVLGESGGLPVSEPTGDDSSLIPMSTQRLEGQAVLREPSEIRDENSVIYRLPGFKAGPSLGDSEDDGLFETEPTAAEARRQPTTPMPLQTPARVAPAPRTQTPSTAPRGAVMRAQPRSPDEPTRPAMAAISEDARPSTLPRAPVNSPAKARSRAPSAPPPMRGPAKLRDGDETTRPSVAAQRAVAWPTSQAPLDEREDEDEEDAGERTVITAAPGFGGNGFFDVRTNAATQDEIPALTSGPDDHTRGDQTFDLGDGDGFMVTGEIEGATQADPIAEPPPPIAPRPRPVHQRSASAAMLAKTPTPSVSELRKPRESRRTPSGGVPVASVLQAIVGAAGSEPMPSGSRPGPARQPTPVSQMPTMITSNAPVYSPHMPGPAHGTSQHPWPVAPGQPTPYPGFTPTSTQQPQQPPQGYPPQPYQHPYQPPAQPYMDPNAAAQSGYPPGFAQPMPQQLPPQYGGRMPGRGELATMQVETLPERYRIQPNRPRWLLISLAAMMSVVGAALITFLVIRSSRESHRPSSLVIDSVPEGAQVFVDDVLLPTPTPATYTARPGERHDVRVELAKHKPYHEAAVLPAAGGELRLNAVLQTRTGRIIIDSVPSGADIYIDGQLRGHTPTKLEDVDLEHVQKLELRHREFGTKVVPLTWPDDGVLTLNVNLKNP